jgi:hypothetical protein
MPFAVHVTPPPSLLPDPLLSFLAGAYGDGLHSGSFPFSKEQDPMILEAVRAVSLSMGTD